MGRRGKWRQFNRNQWRVRWSCEEPFKQHIFNRRLRAAIKECGIIATIGALKEIFANPAYFYLPAPHLRFHLLEAKGGDYRFFKAALIRALGGFRPMRDEILELIFEMSDICPISALDAFEGSKTLAASAYVRKIFERYGGSGENVYCFYTNGLDGNTVAMRACWVIAELEGKNAIDFLRSVIYSGGYSWVVTSVGAIQELGWIGNLAAVRILRDLVLNRPEGVDVSYAWGALMTSKLKTAQRFITAAA